MRPTTWFFHPIVIFIFSIVALALSLFLFIYWYIEISSGLQVLAQRIDMDAAKVLAPQTWVVIVVLSILVGIILMGIFTIFVYNQKTWQLYRLQRQFINNFTHELKTPVTSLQLFLETFKKYNLPRRDQEKYINYMLADIGRLSDNISRILNLARLESKSYQAEFKHRDLVAVIEKCHRAHAGLFDGCRIVVHKPDAERFVYPVDRPLFEMLVMNLLVNAIKYNESERPQVDIRFAIRHRHLRIDFIDNGIGIDRRESRKIFKRFYQAGRPGGNPPRGSGLGLNLVQHIARLHQGRVEAAGRSDARGSVFSLVLPAKRLYGNPTGESP
ncbi:MAG: HAMP domain-containing sensor histidine kinase [Desulfobacterales bacterium]|nr:HAMP domain-containing sensor histidine kinase [Desulfobacterales bacterium]MDJ0856275.1 HAMP domain-containing sensor histidine kinase [Desulfobacterales bacterium]